VVAKGRDKLAQSEHRMQVSYGELESEEIKQVGG
jgi:hypothetical protein